MARGAVARIERGGPENLIRSAGRSFPDPPGSFHLARCGEPAGKRERDRKQGR